MMSIPTLTAPSRRSALRGRSALARVLSGLWLLLYVGMVAGAPVADGLMDHHETFVVHIEDADGGDCPTPHGPEACDLCQLANGFRAVLAPASLDIDVAASEASVATGARGTAPVALTFLDGRSSRAPPLG